MEKRAVIDENTPQPEAAQPQTGSVTTKQAADNVEGCAASRLAADWLAAQKAQAKARQT